MKIIDAHLHLGKDAYFDEIAKLAHHKNTESHLREQYQQMGFVHGIIMGNLPVEVTDVPYPDFLSYCVGLDSREVSLDHINEKLPHIEKHLQNNSCKGVKLYPGYAPFYIYDDRLAPLYELVAKYNKVVVVHTGLTATEQALLKYSHPMVMDEAATKFPYVTFVMCHLGEPWFTDAVAVLEKNPNVVADLSGMLEGKISSFSDFLRKKHFYLERLKGWLSYLGDYRRVMFGTDWPLANLEDYVAFTKEVIPEEYWNAVFFENACRIYKIDPGSHL